MLSKGISLSHNDGNRSLADAC